MAMSVDDIDPSACLDDGMDDGMDECNITAPFIPFPTEADFPLDPEALPPSASRSTSSENGDTADRFGLALRLGVGSRASSSPALLEGGNGGGVGGGAGRGGGEA